MIMTTTMMMRPISRSSLVLLLILLLLVTLVSSSSSSSQSEQQQFSANFNSIIINSADRTINAETHIIHHEISMTVENIGHHTVDRLYLAMNEEQANKQLSIIELKLKNQTPSKILSNKAIPYQEYDIHNFVLLLLLLFFISLRNSTV